MSIADILKRSQLRAEIARIQAISKWKAEPTTYGDKCPFCGSVDYGKYSVENGTQRYRCRSCERRFNQRRVFECNCQEPGQEPSRCHTCPKFEVFIKAFKQYSTDLNQLSREELEVILDRLTTDNSPE